MLSTYHATFINIDEEDVKNNGKQLIYLMLPALVMLIMVALTLNSVRNKNNSAEFVNYSRASPHQNSKLKTQFHWSNLRANKTVKQAD